MGNIRKFDFNHNEYMELPAQIAKLPILKEWLTGIVAELVVPSKISKQILIALDEIFTNISSYGYPVGGGSVRVWVELDEEEKVLTITFADTGTPYNPLETKEPDTTLPLDERPIGGLGIFMVRKMMDSVNYRRENEQNILVLEKKLF